MKNLRIYDPNTLLENLNTNKVPNIGRVVRTSGIKTTTVSTKVMKNYRALAFVNSGEGNIFLNRNLSKEAKRFITTYMYAYVQLYYNNSEDDGLFSQPLFEEQDFDKKAYNYTLRLLMPEKIFKSDIEEGMDNRKLSQKYKVSMYVANERRNLLERDEQKAKFKVIQGGRRG